MIDKGAASEDEMVLEFLRADMRSPDWATKYRKSRYWAHRKALTDEHASPTDAVGNRARRDLLRKGRPGLFRDFPARVEWRRCELSLEELKTTKYLAHCEKWERVSRSTREVGVGARHIRLDQKTASKVVAIARRYRRGEALPALIAVRAKESDSLVMLEGHHRATALAILAPSSVEVLVGTAPQLHAWPFY
jgi:hypothetical protein